MYNLNLELVKKYHNREIGIIYSGEDLKLLRIITANDFVKGSFIYYIYDEDNGHFYRCSDAYIHPVTQYISVNDFLIKEDWKPKFGERVEVADEIDCEKWIERIYVAENPIKRKNHLGHICVNDVGHVGPWSFVRKISEKTITREEAEKQLGLKIID